MVKREPGELTDQAHLEVLEVFKGSPGSKVTVPSPNDNTPCWCGVGPFEMGAEYLIYGYGSKGRVQGSGAMSRALWPVEYKGPELRWLRTGSFASAPEALVRGQVQCEPCSLEAEVAKLVGARGPRLRGRAAEQALKDGRPFWTDGPSSPGEKTVLGLSAKGEPFSLVQRPRQGKERLCRNELLLGTCARLERAPATAGGRPTLQCAEPGVPAAVCSEHYKETWAPREPLQPKACTWHRPDRARCALGKKGPPLADQKAPQWLLACESRSARPTSYDCRVVAPNDLLY
jgi:hypothetical protein